MSDPILVAKKDAKDGGFFLLPQMANRHGVITGATGTGKTVTLQRFFGRNQLHTAALWLRKTGNGRLGLSDRNGCTVTFSMHQSVTPEP